MAYLKLGAICAQAADGDWGESVTYVQGVHYIDGRLIFNASGAGDAPFGAETTGLITMNGVVGSADSFGLTIPKGANTEFDDTATPVGRTIYFNGRYLTYYLASDALGSYRVGLTISDDLIHHTKIGVVIPKGGTGEWDNGNTESPFMIVVDGKIRAYYSHRTAGIGLAVSDDGIHFTKIGKVIPLGASGDFDDTWVTCPFVIYQDGKFIMFYHGKASNGEYRPGIAISDDGIHFDKMGALIDRSAWQTPPQNVDRGGRGTPTVLYQDGYYLIYGLGYTNRASPLELPILCVGKSLFG